MGVVSSFGGLAIFPGGVPSQVFGWIPDVSPGCGCCKWGRGGGEGEMEVHGICNRSLISREKVSSIGQAIRNLIFGDAEISLVGIQQGVTRLTKTGFVYLLAVVWRKRGEGVV